MANKDRIFLPGLNGIRAIAALAVVFSHTNNRLKHFGLMSLPNWDLSGYAVTMFFTLSGFLITFLLFKEQEKTGTINIKKFYIRRILRIWPLYYFYLLIIFLIFGYDGLGSKFIIHLLILPNLGGLFTTLNGVPWVIPSTTAIPLIGHYWSLGVEEQFYSFWPWVIKKIRKLFIFLLVFPIAFFSLKVFAKMMNLSEAIQFVLHYSRFGCLAIGALGAYLYWKKPQILPFINSIYTQVGMWLFFGLIVFNKFHIFSIIDHEIVSVFVVLLIINQISGKRKMVSLENKVFDYLGKISFGIYVYNPLTIFLLHTIAQKYFMLPDSFISYAIVFLLVTVFNIILAHISYFTLEKYFLNWKTKFITVKSVASKKEFNENK